MKEILLASLLGLATTSSAMIGIAVGLYVPISKRLLGCILAFASGGLISALAIELAFNSPNIPSDNDGARARYLVADL